MSIEANVEAVCPKCGRRHSMQYPCGTDRFAEAARELLEMQFDEHYVDKIKLAATLLYEASAMEKRLEQAMQPKVVQQIVNSIADRERRGE